jgi:hypothetical protein
MAVNIKIRARRLLNPLIHYHSWEDSEPKEITSLLPLAHEETALGIYIPHPQAIKDAIVVTSHGLWVFYDNHFNAKFVRYTDIVSTSEPNKTKKGTTLELELIDNKRLILQVTGWNEKNRLTDAALFLQFLIYRRSDK